MRGRADLKKRVAPWFQRARPATQRDQAPCRRALRIVRGAPSRRQPAWTGLPARFDAAGDGLVPGKSGRWRAATVQT